MTNQEIIKKIEDWQSNPNLHPLTCRNGTCGNVLEAVEKGEPVVLFCPACGRIQENIPEIVLK